MLCGLALSGLRSQGDRRIGEGLARWSWVFKPADEVGLLVEVLSVCLGVGVSGWAWSRGLGALLVDRTEQAEIAQFWCDQPPFVSVLLVARDVDDSRLVERLANIASMDYPSTSIELLLATNLAHDEVRRLVEGYPDYDIRFVPVKAEDSRGAVLTYLTKEARGEFMLWTDVHTDLHPDALMQMVSLMGDDTVGVVNATPTSSRRERVAYRSAWATPGALERQRSRLEWACGAPRSTFLTRSGDSSAITNRCRTVELQVQLKAWDKGQRVIVAPGALETHVADRTRRTTEEMATQSAWNDWQLFDHRKRWFGGGSGPVSRRAWLVVFPRLLAPLWGLLLVVGLLGWLVTLTLWAPIPGVPAAESLQVSLLIGGLALLLGYYREPVQREASYHAGLVHGGLLYWRGRQAVAPVVGVASGAEDTESSSSGPAAD